MASGEAKANTSLEFRENCVFCQSNGESGAAASQLKILKCLHVSCKSCAEQFLRYDNTIRCARCQIVTPDSGPGRKLTECLVSWPTQQSVACADSDGDEQDESSPGQRVQSSGKVNPALYCQNSDCEDMNEPAEMRCTTCDLWLCRQHSALHTRSRKRANHSMAAVPPAKRRMRQRDNMELCPLHNEDLETYCKSCNVLMCARCNTSKLHAGQCKHNPVDVKDAAKGLREAEAVLQSEIPDLENRLAAVEARINTVNRETEEISEKINGEYTAALKTIEDSRKKLLRDLDNKRWRAVKQLEKLKEARQDELRTRKTGGYLSTTLNDGAVLRALSHRQMSPETSNTDSGSGGNEESGGDDQKVKVKEEDPENCLLKFNFTPVISSCVKTLVWMVQDPITTNLKTHPHIEAHLSFCNQQPKHISLNDEKTVATCTASTSARRWSSAFAWPPPMPFRVGLLSGEDVIIGFTSVTARRGDSTGSHHERGCFYGWAGRPHHRALAVGGALGQPWVKGDVLRLTLDRKHWTATAVHERTGISETISIGGDQFPVCFTAEMGPKASVRFLSPAIRL